MEVEFIGVPGGLASSSSCGGGRGGGVQEEGAEEEEEEEEEEEAASSWRPSSHHCPEKEGKGVNEYVVVVVDGVVAVRTCSALRCGGKWTRLPFGGGGGGWLDEGAPSTHTSSLSRPRACCSPRPLAASRCLWVGG